MDHLAQDLGVALEESESCGAIPFPFDGNANKWRMRRRTRSAGNLHLLYTTNSAENHSEDSTSSNSGNRLESQSNTNRPNFHHQSDSDEILFTTAVAKVINAKSALRMRHPITAHHPAFLRAGQRYHHRLHHRTPPPPPPCVLPGNDLSLLSAAMSHVLESDSVNEHSSSVVRPITRRKRKLKRMSVDEIPIPMTGKRKRPQRFDLACILKHNPTTSRIKPLHPSVVDKIEKILQPPPLVVDDGHAMETQSIIDECEFASESSISWSGGEGHEGDDELTDWAPSLDNGALLDQAGGAHSTDSREIRAGCRRLGPERRGYSINTSANDRVARFLQDANKSELRLLGGEKEKLSQLASLYALDLWCDGPTSTLLKKTNRTPMLQPTQHPHRGFNAPHKRIRTQNL